MKIVSLKYIAGFVVILVILYIAIRLSGPYSKFTEPNDAPLIRLGSKAKKVVHFAEAVHWPDFDFKNVKEFISIPNSKEKTKFIEVVRQIIDPNYLPEKWPETIRFLRGWRGKDRESFVLEYEKGTYVIRVKDQVTHVQVTKTRRDSTHWITIVIQKKDKSVCVNKSDESAIFNFIDQFLSEKINSKAQNYSGMINMDRPAFTQMDEAYCLAYPVATSFRPIIGFVSIWTDGHTVLVNLKEVRKVIIPTK